MCEGGCVGGYRRTGGAERVVWWIGGAGVVADAVAADAKVATAGRDKGVVEWVHRRHKARGRIRIRGGILLVRLVYRLEQVTWSR